MALASNLPNQESVFYLRESSEPKMVYKMVQDFLLHIFKLQELLMDYIPAEIKRAIKKIDYKLKNSKNKFWKGKTKDYQQLTLLRKFTTLPVYGFNSSKVIWIIKIVFKYFFSMT